MEQLVRLIASTYQAVSGGGLAGVDELDKQANAVVKNSRELTYSGGAVTYPALEKFVRPIAFNVLPFAGSLVDNGEFETDEEIKLRNESRKILHLPDLQTSMTCVRVPVYRAHSIAVHAEFEKPVSVAEAQDALIAASGVDLVDDPMRALYPMPIEVQGLDECQRFLCFTTEFNRSIAHRAHKERFLLIIDGNLAAPITDPEVGGIGALHQ